MIVEPDFPDHWKTQMLVNLTGDASSPMMVIRLWGFCQQRRRWTLDGITPSALAAILRWNSDPNVLIEHLKASGFLDEANGLLEVHGWADTNHQLVTNWKNGKYGKLGGRPQKSGSETHRVANGGAFGTPIREDKTREEKKRTPRFTEKQLRAIAHVTTPLARGPSARR